MRQSLAWWPRHDGAVRFAKPCSLPTRYTRRHSPLSTRGTGRHRPAMVLSLPEALPLCLSVSLSLSLCLSVSLRLSREEMLISLPVLCSEQSAVSERASRPSSSHAPSAPQYW